MNTKVTIDKAIAHIIKTPALQSIASKHAAVAVDETKTEIQKAMALIDFNNFVEGVRLVMEMGEPTQPEAPKYIWRNGARVKVQA